MTILKAKIVLVLFYTMRLEHSSVKIYIVVINVDVNM
jgi:hypothetical protein